MVITDFPVSCCVRCVRRGEIGTPTSQGRTWTGVEVSRTGPCRHSRSHTCCIGRGERTCARCRGWLHSCGIYKVAAPQIGCSRSSSSVESGSRERVWEEIIMHELSMGKLRDGFKLHTTFPCHPASNGVAERMIGYSSMPRPLAMVGSKLEYHGLCIFLVQPISLFRAIAKVKVKSNVKTYKIHPNILAASVSENWLVLRTGFGCERACGALRRSGRTKQVSD